MFDVLIFIVILGFFVIGVKYVGAVRRKRIDNMDDAVDFDEWKRLHVRDIEDDEDAKPIQLE